MIFYNAMQIYQYKMAWMQRHLKVPMEKSFVHSPSDENLKNNMSYPCNAVDVYSHVVFLQSDTVF